jgi:hypothetical protein
LATHFLNLGFYKIILFAKNLEAELQTQNIIRSEQESAFKLIENSLKDKHEIVNILRDQLEQVKSINLDLVNDTQVYNDYNSLL